MSEDLDFLLRPVIKGLCSYSELKDGTLDLYDIDILNEALDVQEENDRRINERL